jgi:hypothetical protein
MFYLDTTSFQINFLTTMPLEVSTSSETNKQSSAFRTYISCEISGSHGGDLKIRVLLDLAPCNLVGVDRCFRGAYCLHHH